MLPKGASSSGGPGAEKGLSDRQRNQTEAAEGAKSNSAMFYPEPALYLQNPI